MRRKDKEIRGDAAIDGILDRARVCRLAMVDGDSPYVVPLCFAHWDGVIYVHSALKGRKIDLLKKNPRVCFEVDDLLETLEAGDPCDWSLRYQSVIGFGRAVFVDDPEEKQKGLNIVFRRYAGRDGAFAEGKMRATAVIRIDIDTMTAKGVDDDPAA